MSLPMFVGSVLVPPDGRVRYRIQSARRPTDATPGEFQARFAGWRPAGEARAWPA